jgi:hypothetical protein
MMEWKNREEIKIFSKELVKKANYDESAKAFVDACCTILSKGHSSQLSIQ